MFQGLWLSGDGNALFAHRRAQAIENVISGTRYKHFTDEAIEPVLGYYGEPVVPVDQNVVDQVTSLPRTRQFVNWTPEGYLKPVDELRKEIGPELSDHDLLLKILIPGTPLNREPPVESSQAAVVREGASPGVPETFPRNSRWTWTGKCSALSSPLSGMGSQKSLRGQGGTPKRPQGPQEIPAGAVVGGMAGLVLSFEVKAGDSVNAGDLVAMIEAMKMRRHVNAPHGGVVQISGPMKVKSSSLTMF